MMKELFDFTTDNKYSLTSAPKSSVNNLYEKAEAARFYIQEIIGSVHLDCCMITGTGLGEIWKEMEILHEIPYTKIPHMPKSTVESHAGMLYICKKDTRHIAVLSGRFHYYEGYSAAQVSFPIRIMKALGISRVLITNVAGGTNATFEAGDIVLVTDHINTQPNHPLTGNNDNRLGVRFPDMLETYDKASIKNLQAYAQKEGIAVKTGVYLALQGPSLETPAEYEYINRIGADLVGMSTVPEVISAVHGTMRVTALSVVSNVCYPLDKITATTVADVIAVAKQATPSLSKLCVKWAVW